MRRFLIFLCIFALCTLHFALAPVAQAQNTPVDPDKIGVDLASIYEIADDKAVDGDILMYQEKGIVRADVPFSNKLFGVLQDKPVMLFKLPDTKGKPVVRSGTAYVNVTAESGEIKAGDYITSSRKPGKGEKMTQSGYVLGVALANFKSGEGKIPVAIRIEYAELTNTRSVLRLLDYFNIAAFQSASDPDRASQLVQYMAAGLIVVVAMMVSFSVFGRSLVKSIEAIGRNPLAKNAIQISLVINAVFTLGVVLIAVAAAFVILQL